MDTVIPISTFVLLPLLLLAISLFIFIPQMLTALQRLERNQREADFSLMVFWGVLTAVFLLFSYLVFVRFYFDYLLVLQSEVVRVGVSAGLLVLTFGLFVPKTFLYFRNWRKNQKSLDFSLTVLFAWLAFLCLSCVFFRLFLLRIGGPIVT